MDAESYHLSATVPAQVVQYLEWLGLEAQSTGGVLLPKATVIRALFNVAMRLNIDVTGVCSQAELERRIWEAIRQVRFPMGWTLDPGEGRPPQEEVLPAAETRVVGRQEEDGQIN